MTNLYNAPTCCLFSRAAHRSGCELRRVPEPGQLRIGEHGRHPALPAAAAAAFLVAAAASSEDVLVLGQLVGWQLEHRARQLLRRNVLEGDDRRRHLLFRGPGSGRVFHRDRIIITPTANRCSRLLHLLLFIHLHLLLLLLLLLLLVIPIPSILVWRRLRLRRRL